jgi:hypothetical protein
MFELEIMQFFDTGLANLNYVAIPIMILQVVQRSVSFKRKIKKN